MDEATMDDESDEERGSGDVAPDDVSDLDDSELDEDQRAPPHRQLFDDDDGADGVLAQALDDTIDSDGMEHCDS